MPPNAYRHTVMTRMHHALACLGDGMSAAYADDIKNAGLVFEPSDAYNYPVLDGIPIDQYGIDSLGITEFSLYIEDAFGVDMHTIAPKFRDTLAELADKIISEQQKAGTYHE